MSDQRTNATSVDPKTKIIAYTVDFDVEPTRV
jgi:hypothetical protein